MYLEQMIFSTGEKYSHMGKGLLETTERHLKCKQNTTAWIQQRRLVQMSRLQADVQQLESKCGINAYPDGLSFKNVYISLQ